jgi:hypothetical protein
MFDAASPPPGERTLCPDCRSAGSVSVAYDEWSLVDRDIRAFLRLSLRMSRLFYNSTWSNIVASPSSGDDVGLPDLFEKATEGLYEQQFEWMLLAGVLKDAVTAFEVYLEKAAHEVLGWHHEPPLERSKHEESPRWATVSQFYQQRLGCTFSAEITHIRRLRHVLVHQRGELRTEEQRSQFGDSKQDTEEWPPADEVQLTEESVLGTLNALTEAVNQVDAKIYRMSWGGEQLPTPAAETLGRKRRNGKRGGSREGD